VAITTCPPTRRPRQKRMVITHELDRKTMYYNNAVCSCRPQAAYESEGKVGCSAQAESLGAEAV
jgi:hypothetical protein